MSRQILNGEWELCYGSQRTGDSFDMPDGGWNSIPATVPGNVELDLIAAGLLEDPTTGTRAYSIQKYESYEWWYSRTFRASADFSNQRVDLVFEGLDCYGTIWINGEKIGTTDNMLIPYRFDVSEFIKPCRDNEIRVRITSAVLAGRQHEIGPYEYAQPWNFDSINVRKAQHMFGWDIMPRIVSAGLWRDVYLESIPPTHWRSVYWATLEADPVRKSAKVFVDWDFKTERLELEGLQVHLRLMRNGETAYSSQFPALTTHGRRTIELTDIELWWPSGYGEAALYEASLSLIDEDGNELDVQKEKIGLRTIELKRTEVSTHDEPGEFVFIVNGERVFIRGTNWVPLDAFHSRDVEHLENVFTMAVDLNCNMLRCWGGNVYENHLFFNLCDEYGILVWQDFGLACHIYPQNDNFATRMKREAEVIVKKLRNHPSLALWAGNNEIDMAFNWDCALNLDPNTERLSRRVLPEVCLQLDPKRPYLPSSPYKSAEVMKRGGDLDVMPEVHLWRGRPHYKDAFYTGKPAQFVSEIGYHGCPNRESLEQFLDPEHLWPWQDNEQWYAKAVRPVPEATQTDYRIPVMEKKILHVFDAVPDNLDDFILASQIVQAEANKFFVEWWRQGKWRRTGILWWNLRDGWPIFSDAVVDYYNRKKLAYYYLKRSQQAVCTIVGEAVNGLHPVMVVNDTMQDIRGTVTISDADSKINLFQEVYDVPKNGFAVIGSVETSREQAMWLIEWDKGSREGYNHYLAGEPKYALEDYKRWLTQLNINRNKQ